MRARVGLAAVLLATGCLPDLEQYRNRADAAPADAPADTPSDILVLPDASCQPTAPTSARLRIAHMATGFEPVDLCARRSGVRGLPFEKIARDLWPASGLPYAGVSRYVTVALDPALLAAGRADPRDLAVVPHDGPCTDQLASVSSVELRAGVMGTLLFLAAPAPLSRMNATMFLLRDAPCAACPQTPVMRHDLRAVHAMVGAADLRLDMAVVAGRVPFLLARNIPYGNSGASQLDDDYHCAYIRSRALNFSAQINGSGGEELMASEGIAIPAEAARTRLATLFLHGIPGSETAPPSFSLCFDELETDTGLTLCAPLRSVVRDAGGDAGGDAARDASSDTEPPDDAPVAGNDTGQPWDDDAGQDAGETPDLPDAAADDDAESAL